MQPTYDLAALRREFPIVDRTTYLNHASISPLPGPVHRTVCDIAEQLALDPLSAFGPSSGHEIDNVFATFSAELAEFVNAAHAHEVAPLTSTSAAVNALARAVDWQPGDNVVMCDLEFPSNVYPFMALEPLGVELRFAPAIGGGLTVESLDGVVDERTRIVLVSHVQFLTGQRADLAALGAYCRARGIFYVVDAIQSAGHTPIDVQAMQIDALLVGGQKSLMATPGTGLFYVAEAAAEHLKPGLVGANAVEGWEHWLDYDLTPRQGALRFYMGTSSIIGMAAAIAAVRFLQGLGVANIAAWTEHLSDVAIEDLTARGYDVITPRDPAQRCNIVSFHAGDRADMARANEQAAAMYAHLAEQGIQLARHLDAAGWPYLRIATHCYNTEDEVLRVGAALEDFDA